jgi:hypothetical protein
VPQKLRVYAPAGEYIVGYATQETARRMIRLGQAKSVSNGNRAIRLTFHYENPEHPCRTHTSCGGMRAAIGLSQVYTVAERDRVTRFKVFRFKTIFAEDRQVFHQATLDCMATT